MGFTNGIAVLIIRSQIKEFFGLQIDIMPGEFMPKVLALVNAASTMDVTTLVLAFSSALFIWFYPKSWAKKYPHPLLYWYWVPCLSP